MNFPLTLYRNETISIFSEILLITFAKHLAKLITIGKINTNDTLAEGKDNVWSYDHARKSYSTFLCNISYFPIVVKDNVCTHFKNLACLNVNQRHFISRVVERF